MQKTKQDILDRVCDNTVKAFRRDGFMIQDIYHDEKCVFVTAQANNTTMEIKAGGGFTGADSIVLSRDKEGKFVPRVETKIRKYAAKNNKCSLWLKMDVDTDEPLTDVNGKIIRAGSRIHVEKVGECEVVSYAGREVLASTSNGRLITLNQEYCGAIEVAP